MPSHKRQPRPIFPPAFTVKALADSLGIRRAVIDDAKRDGALGPFFKIGVRSFVCTEDVVRWIRSQKRG